MEFINMNNLKMRKTLNNNKMQKCLKCLKCDITANDIKTISTTSIITEKNNSKP